MPIILFIIWILLLLLLTKLRLRFFVFILGCVGLFCFMMYLGKDTAEQYLEYAVTYCIWIIANATKLFHAFPDYSMVTSYYMSEAISFFIDYECSGFIEILVYISLLSFYPVYRLKRKLLLAFIGTLYIFISNIIRVFTICTIIKYFGPNLFFFSHTVFARVLFFSLMVGLYYVVFTKPHILKQKVGNMTYGV